MEWQYCIIRKEVFQMNVDALKTYDNQFTTSERKQLVAEMLKAMRETEKLQQKELAELLGIKPQTYSAYELGRNEPPVEILVRLSKLYDVPIDILVQKDTNKDSAKAKEQLEMFDKQIQELKKEMLEKGSNAKMEQLIKAIEEFNSTLKDKI